jgi:hypothetical protein
MHTVFRAVGTCNVKLLNHYMELSRSLSWFHSENYEPVVNTRPVFPDVGAWRAETAISLWMACWNIVIYN